VEDIRAAGHVSLRAMAAELNRRGMQTRRGGKWRVSNVWAFSRKKTRDVHLRCDRFRACWLGGKIRSLKV
jgi:hypothetical protein